MFINRLEIKGFGKLTDRTFNLVKGINIVFGSNEAGKTTLQWFIKGMLYGLKNSRQLKSGALPPLRRFEPWSGGQYGGAMEYTLDDGSTYRVERDFKRGTVCLYDSNFKDVTFSFGTGRDKMPLFAEKQLGLDEAAFERTVLIRQSEIRLDDAGTGILAERLANVSSTGTEDISFSRAEKALTDALKNNVGTGRTTTQPLDKLERRLKELEEEGERLRRLQEQRQENIEELQKVREKILKLQAEKRFLECISQLTAVRKALDAGLKKEAALKEALKQLKYIDEAKTGMESVKVASSNEKTTGPVWRKRALPLCLIAAAVAAAAIIFKIVSGSFQPIWHFIPLAAGFILSVLLCLNIIYKSDKEPSAGYNGSNVPKAGKLEADSGDNTVNDMMKNNIYSNISLLCGKRINSAAEIQSELAALASELEELSGRLDKGIQEAGSMESDNSLKVNKYNFETLLYDQDANELEKLVENEMVKINDEMLNAALKEKYIEGILNDVQEEREELQRVEEETFAIKERIVYLNRVGAALKLARDVLTEAAGEIKSGFTPGLNERMGTIIRGLTGNRYNDIRSDDRLVLNVSVPESGDVKNVLSLSGATADQMYLALRLSMAWLLTEGGESLPLLMDEAFSQFDDNNTGLALKYLHNVCEKKQVIIFTCKKREVELAADICGSGINLVEL